MKAENCQQTPKPVPLPVQADNILPELKRTPRWVLWRYTWRNNQWTKPPYQPNGRHARSNDLTTWSRFEDVYPFDPNAWDGIGFLLGDGYCGVDLDKCRDPNTAALTPAAAEIIKQLDTYTEVSPSATGVKMLLKGEKPAGWCKVTGLPSYDGGTAGAIEMYDRTRYFTVTGAVLNASPVEQRQEQLRDLHAQFAPNSNGQATASGKPTNDAEEADRLGDTDVILMCRGRPSGQRFAALFDRGDTSDYHDDDSAADLALCSFLVRGGATAAQVDRLFRRSALYREKWDREDYRRRTIERAMRQGEDDEVKGASVMDDGDDPQAGGPSKFDKKARGFVDYLCRQRKFPLYHGGRFYLYDGTRYVEEPELDQAVRTYFKLHKMGQSNNTIGNVSPIVKNLALKSESQYGPMPFFVQKDGDPPFPKQVIAYRNGLLDLEAYMAGRVNLLPHTPRWFSTFALPYDFRPEASCPLWLAKIDEIFDGDAERVSLLQEYMGYCISLDTSKQKALMMVGKRRGGKGTIQHVLQQVMGMENWAAYSLDNLVSAFGMSALVNRSVAFVGEVELQGNKDRARILEKLKSIIGEDPQQINIKHDPVMRSVRLPTRFVIACNTLPVFFDPSQALSSRFLFLAFERSFAGKEDEELREKLVQEVEGISIWALHGLRRLKQTRKFTLPATHQKLMNQFSSTAAPVARFIEECLWVHRSLDPGDLPEHCLTDERVSVPRASCFQEYQEWGARHEISVPEDGSVYFGRDLRAVLTKLKPNSRRRVDGLFQYYYDGIGIRESEIAKIFADPEPVATG